MKSKKILSVILVLVMIACAIAGCNKTEEKRPESQPLRESDYDGNKENEPGGLLNETPTPSAQGFVDAQNDFSVELFREVIRQRENDGNILISPLSISIALGMTANGADKATLEEFEELFGMDIDTYTKEMRNYLLGLPSTEEASLKRANSIWIRDVEALRVHDGFIMTSREKFSAEIYKEPFDENTADKINKYVSDKTDGMIDHIIDEIAPETMMYLINALLFDAKWAETYYDYSVHPGEFHTQSGETHEVRMLYSEEWGYLEDENATGFVKDYCNGYRFAALLPNEGISVFDYAEALDSDELYAMLSAPRGCSVITRLPEFKYEFSAGLVPVLEGMGLELCFDSKTADFTKMADCAYGNLYIGNILHKTAIDLTQYGTKAAAVTSVELDCESDAPMEEPKTVILDRPFIYMIIDKESDLPVFMGVVTDIGE